MKAEDVEKLVVDLAKHGTPSEKIGLILRDQHGIPKVQLVTKKKISQILDENNLDTDSEKVNITKRIDGLRKHVEKNKQDYTAKQKLTKRLARLRKMSN